MGLGSLLRVRKERVQLESDPIPGVTVEFIDGEGGQTESWMISIKGAEGTPYAAGLFLFKMCFHNYPFKAPVITCLTDICHCNLTLIVSPNEVYASSLFEEGFQWSPVNKARAVIERVRALMAEPYGAGPGECDTWHDAPTFDPRGCSGGMTLIVKTMSGQDLIIDAGPTDLVASLKFEIQKKEGIPIGEQNLVFAGTRLRNHMVLSDYGIQTQSSVHFVSPPIRGNIDSLINCQMAGLLNSAKGVYEQHAREHTLAKALDPEHGPLIAVELADGQAVKCYRLSGEEVTVRCGELTLETVGSLRSLLAAELNIPAAAVRLVSSSGNELNALSDDVPLLKAVS